jgi:hypothetical protein
VSCGVGISGVSEEAQWSLDAAFWPVPTPWLRNPGRLPWIDPRVACAAELAFLNSLTFLHNTPY